MNKKMIDLSMPKKKESNPNRRRSLTRREMLSSVKIPNVDNQQIENNRY